MLSSASHQQLLIVSLYLLWMTNSVLAKSSQFSDLKSKISGVEELLEEFSKQLQQDQALSREDGAGDVCLSGFNAIEGRIIRAKYSIELGASFLTAPVRVYSWSDCLHACCADPRCNVAVVQEDSKQADDSLGCFLFNCTHRNKNVCTFAVQQGYSTYGRIHNNSGSSPSTFVADLTKQANSLQSPHDKLGDDDLTVQDVDEPPRSDAGQDVVIQLPTDWAVLDGRDSVDDHGIVRYEWALIQGNPSVNMKVTQPGILKLSGLREGSYSFEMIVTDMAGQRSTDNITITVLPPEHKEEACRGRCFHYQFTCDDGCCVDISYACDGKQQCPDRSDEAFCQSFEGSRKAVTHSSRPGLRRPFTNPQEAEDRAMMLGETVEKPERRLPPPPPPYVPTQQDGRGGPCSAPPAVGPCKSRLPRWFFDPPSGVCKHFLYGGCEGNSNNFLQEEDCVSKCIQRPGPQEIGTDSTPSRHAETSEPPQVAISGEAGGSNILVPKPHPGHGGHPVPESGAILPLALGLAITALLLLMVICRLRMVRHKLKKARPITSEESDYLINGMYL